MSRPRPRPRRLLSPDAPLDGAPLSREEAQAMIERVIKRSKADAVEVQLTSTYTANTRFAANQMSTAGSAIDTVLTVQSSFGT